MRVLSDRDYGLIERLVALTQKELHATMSAYLKEKYKKVIATKDYIVAVGEEPVALISHLDTVFSSPAYDMYYDQRKGVLWSPDGLGSDDRAGVFAIIKIIQAGYRPTIIFTTDEELGGRGAQVLAKTDNPAPSIKYLIQLDREGSNDCVFYNCYNSEFMSYVFSFGFCEAIGSFTDISFLMPAWQICGVNISVGYKNNHTCEETLHINALFDTVEKVKKMIEDSKNCPRFTYGEAKSPIDDYWKQLSQEKDYSDEVDTAYNAIPCEKCDKHYFTYELLPVKGCTPTSKTRMLCPQCVDKLDINWCDICGFAYEVEDIMTDACLCAKCLEV